MTKRFLITFLVLACAVYLGGTGYLYLMQRSYIYHPDSTPPQRTEEPASLFADITVFSGPDSLPLHAWYKPPASPNKAVLLFFHGNKGDIGHRAYKTRGLLEAGYGVLLAEYRGYGGNPGTPSEVRLYEDARAYMDFLTKGKGIAAERIVLYGESLGTGVAVAMAKEHPALRGLILESPYTSMTAMARRRYFYVPVDLLLKDRYDSLSKIGGITMPLLILHGKRDSLVPFTFGRSLFEQAGSKDKVFETFPEGGHNDLYEYGAGEKILAFLNDLSGRS